MLGFNGGTIGVVNDPFTGGDPNYSNVSLLLNGNGTNGSTTFTDSSSYGHTVTANGNAQISTAQSKFGGASMYFDGNGDYLTTGPDSSLSLDSGDFTVEAFIYATNLSSELSVIASSRAVSSASDLYWTFSVTSTGQLEFQSRSASQYFARSATSAITVNTWYHVAAVRQNNIITVYVNGVAGPTTVNDGGINLSESYVGVGIFNYPSFVFYFTGYIDDLRITKGVARYNNNFTPPTAQLPGGEAGTFASGLWTSSDHISQIRNELWPVAIVTDGLVLNLDAGDTNSYPGSGTTWFDLSGNGNNGTLIGSPSYTASPGYFDITSDSTYARLSSYSHGTNDFTYSMWVKFDAFDTADTLIENGSWFDCLLLRVENTTSITVYIEGGLRGTFTWNPSTGNWYNVVYTRSGSTNTLYVNETQSGSTFTDQTNISIANAYTFLMRSQHTTNQFTNGQLAQYAMYNKALSQSEITQNFNALKGRYGL